MLDALYATLQLFVLNVSLTPPLGWEIQIARFLAPAVTAYAAIQAFFMLFREQFRLVRLQFTTGHVIVCGLGKAGFKLALDELRRGRTVVILEEESGNDQI